MTFDQAAIIVILGCTLAAFVLDRWRFDLVAASCLTASVIAGVVTPEDAFSGFGNTAVVTVAAVLVIGRALAKSGSIDLIADRLAFRFERPTLHLAILCGLGGFLSGFMNNVAALALMLPVAMSLCRRFRYPPSLLMMPLSFATLLGGMTTLIGTPSNLLIANFREEATGVRFMMFDFTPTGAAVAAGGLLFLVLVGWRLLPAAQRIAEERPTTGGPRYATELQVRPSSPLAGRTVSELAEEYNVAVHGILREGRRVFGRLDRAKLLPLDILLVRTDADALQRLTDDGIELAEKFEEAGHSGHGTVFTEAIIGPNSLMQGSTPASLDLPRRWGIGLVAVDNQGRRFEGRLHELSLREGDVLLLKGDEFRLREVLPDLGCLPLADRKLAFEPRRAVLPAVVFASAILLTSTGILSAAVAMVGAIIALVLARAIGARDVYESIDWPVIVLLAAMIPVGNALETTGAARYIAGEFLGLAGHWGPTALLAITLFVTMAITPVLNNVATVVVMAPIVISIAEQTGARPEPFLIAVAIGASCDFLTPFGHHNNTIIMGLGNYRFGDYGRIGLPLDVIVVVLALLTIPLVWPVQ